MRPLVCLMFLKCQLLICFSFLSSSRAKVFCRSALVLDKFGDDPWMFLAAVHSNSPSLSVFWLSVLWRLYEVCRHGGL